MRTAIILLAGFVLWGVCLGAAKLGMGIRSSRSSLLIFLVPVVVALIVKWRFL